MNVDSKLNEKHIWNILESVSDPEIPVLTIVDLGIVRKVSIDDNNHVVVTITPTYSGCPAMKLIEEEISEALKKEGVDKHEIETVINPPWTTDWLSHDGARKLKEYGIAPPQKGSQDKNKLFDKPKNIQCPNCGSLNTSMKSQFGSTPCKSLYVCDDCSEPFDYFKCI